ncbi:F-box/LRR-repeat protein 13-like [Lycium ferocissimum]|uniref:F-box/LRR-repeat protein 13-like n=1 Tax=Lycium ferocissimum TaxID=112874 RepID=UPI0028149A1D|nr:F-box/LRR-repeat protein 13-like [Lycium ferocissimum]
MAKSLSATADILPECLIKKILGNLSFKEAAKKSILSKTWLQAWLTVPYLKLSVDFYKDAKIVDAILERYRDKKIHIDKFEFSNFEFSNCSLLIDKWLDITLQSGVKDIVYGDPYHYIRSYPFPIFKVLAAESLGELVLTGCDLIRVSLSSGVTNCHSLRKLSLCSVRLDDNMLQTLLNSCPFIVSFNLDNFLGLEKIELLNLQKIKSVSIRKNNLKSLHISDVMISDGFLQDLISRSPNLVSLEYKGDQAPELTITKKSSQLKHSKIVLECYNKLNAAWFCKLRKFLSNYTSWSQVSLCFAKCNEINMKNLHMHDRVATLKVDVLNVRFSWQSTECPTFVDALLWSCHPRRLNLHSTSELLTCFIDRLMYMKNLSHSPSHESEPWLSQLKEIKAFDGKSQLLEYRSGELAIRTRTDWEEVYFLLDW